MPEAPLTALIRAAEELEAALLRVRLDDLTEAEKESLRVLLRLLGALLGEESRRG